MLKFILPVLLIAGSASAELKTVDGNAKTMAPAMNGSEGMPTSGLSEEQMKELMKTLSEAKENMKKRNQQLEELYESM